MELVKLVIQIGIGSGIGTVAIIQIRKGLDKYWEYRISKHKDETEVKVTRANNRGVKNKGS
jgi:hypothetical protein